MNGGRPGVACFSFDFFLVPCFSLHPPYTSAGREINCRRAQLILGEINILEEEPEEREDKERTKRGEREEKERRKRGEREEKGKREKSTRPFVIIAISSPRQFDSVPFNVISCHLMPFNTIES